MGQSSSVTLHVTLYLDCIGGWYLLLASVVVTMTRYMHSKMKENVMKVLEEYFWDFWILFEMSASDF